jgi:prepilin-type N-terminal cleavage/methylation domain-containing protein
MLLRGRRSDQAGFTLVEVLTAASLIGVVTVIAATNFRAQMPSLRARGAALKVAGDINQARLAAIKEGRRYFYVPGEGNTYTIEVDDGLGGTTIVKDVDISNDFTGVVFGATAITEDPYGNAGPAPVPAGALIFHSNGTVQNPAGIFLEAAYGDEWAQQAVTVTAAGRVRVWHHGAGGWS